MDKIQEIVNNRHGKRTFFTLNYPLVHLPDFLWICVYSLFKIVQQTNLVS